MTQARRFWNAHQRGLVRFVTFAALLAVVAALTPAPWYATDRGAYETIGRQWIVPDCSDLQCFRVLVAWTLEHLPGPSLFKWKAYAVLANAGAAVALGQLCAALGLSRRPATYAMWLAAFGFGSLYTLFDPYTSDPLMFLLGPALLTLLLSDRIAAASVVASVGVLAKEFAVAPLWIFAIASAIAREWDRFYRVLLGAMTATLICVALHTWLTLKYNYSLADNTSTHLLSGGFLRVWVSYVTPRVAAAVVFAEFGALFLLIPAGLWWASRQLRQFAIAAVPALVALAYVQQPDRALWNFHFLAIPLAVLVLDALPPVLAWLFVATYALANLRVGAQIGFVPSARFPVAVSVLLALAAIAWKIASGAGAKRPIAAVGS
jgi:hypothetical protein